MAEGTRVLLVDDDPGLLKALEAMLRDAGYEVFTARDGQAGLAAALTHKPHVAVIDVIMRRPDEGFVLSRALRAEPVLEQMKILVLTAAPDRYGMAFEPDAKWLPVDGVLEKPITAEALVEEMERVLQTPAG